MAFHERSQAEGLIDPHSGLDPRSPLGRLEAEIAGCARCPRLVDWRERVARERRAAYAEERYWGRPVVGFGDPEASLLVFGLAPAAHGGNRTGRVFTGDRSGDWLFRALHRAGFANQPHSTGLDDGLRLDGAFIAAAVRCAPPANRPRPDELANCLPYAERELELIPGIAVTLCLGAYAWAAACRIYGVKPRPRFFHRAEHELAPGKFMLASFHPSQQNTFTGKLTEPMLDAVFARARELIVQGRFQR